MLDTQDTIRSFDPGWVSPEGSRAALAFECTDPADVDATYERMIAVGFLGHLPPWNAFWGYRYACLHDPDGNGVDLFAALADQ